jgi:hypothetical protein
LVDAGRVLDWWAGCLAGLVGGSWPGGWWVGDVRQFIQNLKLGRPAGFSRKPNGQYIDRVPHVFPLAPPAEAPASSSGVPVQPRKKSWEKVADILKERKQVFYVASRRGLI